MSFNVILLLFMFVLIGMVLLSCMLIACVTVMVENRKMILSQKPKTF